MSTIRDFPRTRGILTMVVLAATLALPFSGNAATGESSCSLDWNDDGVVDITDILVAETWQGIYYEIDVYTTPAYNPYFSTLYPERDPMDLDWDGNGIIEFADLYTGSPSSSNLQTYYTEWYVYTTLPDLYPDLYPNSDWECLTTAANQGYQAWMLPVLEMMHL